MTIKQTFLFTLVCVATFAQINAMQKKQWYPRSQQLGTPQYYFPAANNPYFFPPVVPLTPQQHFAIQQQVAARQQAHKAIVQEKEQQILEIKKYLAIPGLPEKRKKQLSTILDLPEGERSAVAGMVLGELKKDQALQHIINPAPEIKEFAPRQAPITEDGELERSITQIVEEKGSPKKQSPQANNAEPKASLYKWQPETCFDTNFNTPFGATTVVLPKFNKKTVDPITFNDWSQSITEKQEEPTWRIASFDDRKNEPFKLF